MTGRCVLLTKLQHKDCVFENTAAAMDKNQKNYLLRKAQSGELTEEEYEKYLELLQNDSSFFDELRWDEFLSLQTKIAQDEAFYDAANQFSMPSAPKTYPQQIVAYFQQYPYYTAFAASFILLLIVGVSVWRHQSSSASFVFIRNQQMEVYAAQQTPSRGLGYAEGLPIGELPIQWWEAPQQKAQLAYIFCEDTLKLYTRDKPTQDSLLTKIQLEYEAMSQQYAIGLFTTKQLLVDSCRTDPKVLLP